MIQIALFSDDRNLRPLLSSALGKEFRIRFEPGETDAEHIPSDKECDVVILDMDVPPALLGQRLDRARQLISAQAPLILMADDGLRSAAIDLVRQGAFAYCRKPPSIRELTAMLRKAHEHASLKRELQNAQSRLESGSCCDRLIGSSPQMRKVYDLVRRVADLSASVLITGESGTGKELIARAIHNTGTRAGKPFVAVSCGAIPETLIEAELFGHEKGAFTGTVGTREGYLEQAGDGTLFLDEIGELSLATQVKLLRVLQQREYSRLGSNKLLPLRARVVFATHQNLDSMVAQGRFRQDLFYRINVMHIEAPSLQEHPEDIARLSLHFLAAYCELYHRQVEDIHPHAMAALESYSWPGNIRELENVIQRAVIVANERTIRLEHLPRSIQEVSVVSIEDYQPDGSFERQLRDYKVKIAVAAVKENQGNKTLAARSLHISRAYLHRLIRIAEPDALIQMTGQDAGMA